MDKVITSYDPPYGGSRRKILTAAAWAAPAIAVAISIPQASASPAPSDPPLQQTNLTMTTIGWNDGANGNLAQGSGTDRYYPANFPLFYDTTFVNTGQSIITGIRFHWSLETSAHDFTTNPPSSYAIYNGAGIAPTGESGMYDQGAASGNPGQRTANAYDFTGLTLAPGETIVIRTNYSTTGTAGVSTEGRPYGVAYVTAVTPTSGFSATTTESNTADNAGSVTYPYAVRT